MHFTEISEFDLDAQPNQTEPKSEAQSLYPELNKQNEAGQTQQTTNTGDSPTGLTEFDLEDPNQEGGEGEPFISREYLDEMFNSGKLIPFVDDKDQVIYPKTVAEFQDLIEENRNTWTQSVMSEDESKVLERIKSNTTPAMQFVIDNASKFRDPAQLVPLLNSVSEESFLAELDIDDENHQELIVRKVFEIQGLGAEAADEEIIFLKDNDRLRSRAEAAKPTVDKYQAQVTNQVLQEREQRLQNEQQFWTSYHHKFVEDFYKASEVDGIRFKQEDKNKIASLVLPDSKIGGLPIYNIIDRLVEAGDVVTLSKLALLGSDSQLFDTYYGSAKKDAVATGLQRKLRDANTSNSTQSESYQNSNKNTQGYGWYNK